MQLKSSKYLAALVLILLIVESVSAAVHSYSFESRFHQLIHTKNSKTSVFSFIACEREGEQNEEEKDKFLGIELADLNQLAVILSFFHSPQVHTSSYEQHCNIRPSLYMLHCVLLI